MAAHDKQDTSFVPDADEQERLQQELQADIEQLDRDGGLFEQAFTELWFARRVPQGWAEIEAGHEVVK